MSRRSPPHSSHRTHRRSPSPRRERERHSERDREPRDRSREKSEEDPSGVPKIFLESGPRGDAPNDNRNVLERMQKAYLGGPLEMLHRSAKNKVKCKIWTRNFKEVRGICTGFVEAFDKHWNVVLKDVDEICLKPKKGKTPYLLEVKVEHLEKLPDAIAKVYVPKKPKPAVGEAAAAPADKPEIKMEVDDDIQIVEPKTEKEGEGEAETEAAAATAEGEGEGEKKKKRPRKKKKNKVERRHIPKLFIRGDNIVMVATVKDMEEEEEAQEQTEEPSEGGNGETREL